VGQTGYKVRPGFNFTYTNPVNKRFGFTLSGDTSATMFPILYSGDVARRQRLFATKRRRGTSHWSRRAPGLMFSRDWPKRPQAQPLESRFGISADAARLLGWLQQLASRRLTSGWSPNVEESNEREIGLKPVMRSEDFAFHLRTLLDERMPFIITSYSYTEYTNAKTMLKLASKPSDLDLVVRQLQWLGLQQGKLVAREAAVHAITAFLARAPASSNAAT
jgi:hypothetical protein